ncbi:uncharacterized protein LOC126291804 [Schistocerca gregaria]|uniref:uncharacterized protein LOC126291804 n=1 Tax=Schistocerca gregaria TaxID=7010 RepID=UPI00211E73B9|nr:uncharacterized protein LOC126291804 [Schistocerca gregaria]
MGLSQSSVPYRSFRNPTAARPVIAPTVVVPSDAHIGRAPWAVTDQSSLGQTGRSRGVGRRLASSGRGPQRPDAGAVGRLNRQSSKRRHKTRYVYRRQPSQRQRRQRNGPSSLRNGLVPEETQTPSSELEISRSPAARFPKLKAPADNRGVDYEERTLALAFLRCLRDNLRFDISSNNEAAGKFDDLVLRWQYGNSADTYLLLAQLKHRSPTHGSSEVVRAMLLPPSGRATYGNDGRPQNFGVNNRFSLAMYQDSYHHIKDKLQTPNFTMLLSTNAPLARDTKGMFVRRSLYNVPGAEFMDTGGTLYGLNPNDEEVRRAVNNDHRFIEHFAIFCQQKDSEEIKDAICREIEILLAPGDAEGYIYERLCREIREWKLNDDLWLGESWKKWTDLVNDYTEKYLCQCGDKRVRPPIVFNGVDNIKKFVNGHNPTQITPVRKSTMALTASKIHQAVGSEPHIMLSARRYRQLRQQVLCVWGRFCKWLVVLDDGPEDDTEVFEELSRELSHGRSRRLVFVTSKKGISFVDTFGSFEVTDECWSKFLEIKVRLNGEHYLCCLRDLVGDAGSIKILMDNRPEDVLTLSQLPDTVDMGQQLDPVPEYYVSRRVELRRYVTEDFFLSLGEKDVCVINQASYAFLPARAWGGVILDLRRLDIVLSSPNRMWPLLTIAGDADRSAFEEFRARYPDVRLYALNYSAAGWEMLYFSSQSYRVQPYIKMREVQVPEKLDFFGYWVVLEGAPGIGKSTMLAAVARQMKAIDPAYWIVKVNFSEFYNIFDNCDNIADALEQVLMHVTSSKDQLGPLERTLLCHCLQHSSRVVCLVDGFDELTSTYTDLSLQILKQLSPHKGGMVVTARPTANKLLEETLGSMACLLTTFNDVEWQVFLRKYSQSSPDSINRIATNYPKHLLRFPLLCKMCADLTEPGLVADALELYYTFFRRKCQNLWIKKHGDGGKQEFEEQWKRYEEQLMHLAVSFLIQRKDRLGQRPYYQTNRDFFVEAEIMCKSADGRLVFVHRTFAEYFLAKWCSVNIKQQECAVIYREALLEKNLEFFVWTFDRMTSKGHRLLELIVDGNESDVMVMLNSRQGIEEVDGAGRNALHLATVYSEPWTVVQRLCTRGTPTSLEAEDGFLHWTPLRYAAELGRWPTVAALIKAGAKLVQLGDFRAGKQDFNELKNWLPEFAFKKFLEHVHFGNKTHSDLQQNLSKTNATKSSIAEMASSNNVQQHSINTRSILQSHEWQSTAKPGTSSQVWMAPRNKSQLDGKHESGTVYSPKRNGRPSIEKAITPSHIVVNPLNVPQPQVHNGKNVDSSLYSSHRQDTARIGPPPLVTALSKKQQLQVLNGQATDSGLETNGHPTATNGGTTSRVVAPLFDADDMLDDNGLQSNQHQNSAKAGPSSPLVKAPSNDRQQQAADAKSGVDGLQSNEGPSRAEAESSFDMENAANDKPQTHVRHGRSIDSSLESNVGQATPTTTLPVEVGMHPNNNSSSSATPEKCSYRFRCQFSVLALFRALFCCSTDNGPDHIDNSVTHIH